LKASAIAAVALTVAVLYFARDLLIPLALAILLSFLLVPAVSRLERWRLGRVPATALVVILVFSFIGAIGWIAAHEAVSLAAKLPEYRENIVAKIRAVRAPSDGKLGQAAEAIKDLESEAAEPSSPPVAVVDAPPSPLAALAEMVAPFAKPLGMALAVIIFTILMLLNREDMRDRLIGLVGAGRINITTQAIGEASERVSRYLFMQLVVNAGFGTAFGIALYFIGIPSALLWGLLTTFLRFIPYGGIWIAIALPLTLAFAISDGWSLLAWTVGVFLLLELIFVYGIEPWLYGRSTGLSPIAIIGAVIFWTWLWGPVGLLLATPLTVCATVMGRYIPELAFLNVLLGVEPVLTPEARLFQRLIALDDEEASDLAEKYVEEHGLGGLFDGLLMPTLALLERDRHKGLIDAERERFAFDTLRRMVEEVDETVEATEKTAAPRRGPPVCIVAAHDEADHVAGLILARLLPPGEFNAHALPFPVLAAEAVEQAGAAGCRIIVVSAVPPQAATQASYLIRRLRKAFPEAKIVTGLWTSEENIERNRARLLQAGADEVVTRLPQAVEKLRNLSVPLALASQQPKVSTSR
jgi:predicted PurR-regulated permease PerM/methylmalonyl-CoA mutase cobalamin-binding subunit